MNTYHNKQGFVYNMQKYWQLYVFLFLPVIYLLVFKYYPMLGLQIAFKKFTVKGGIWGSPWVGFDNFVKLFTSYQFKRILPNTVIISFFQLIASFPIPILLALCFNVLKSKRQQKFVQTVTYIPHFISTVVLVGMLFQVFNARTGLFGMLYEIIAGTKPNDLFGNPNAFRPLFIGSGIWQSSGWSSIIYIATLAGVSQELHEAAQLDGASRFKRVLHVDFPSIVPTITIMLILQAGTIMNVGFEKIYLMQNDLNLNVSEVISTYVYKVGLAAGGGDFSYATAIGLFNSVVNMMLLITVNGLSKRLSESSLW